MTNCNSINSLENINCVIGYLGGRLMEIYKNKLIEENCCICLFGSSLDLSSIVHFLLENFELCGVNCLFLGVFLWGGGAVYCR